MSSYFKVYRGWRDNPVFKSEFSRGDAWMWLIENACWKESRVRIKGDNITLARGEMTFAVRFLAEKWGWSKSRVDRFIGDLRDEGMIETRTKIGTTDGHKAGQGQSILTICNYEKYQGEWSEQRDNDFDASGTTAGQQRDNSGTKKKKDKNFKKDNPNGLSLAKSPKKQLTSLPDGWRPKPFTAGTECHRITANWDGPRKRAELEAFISHHHGKGSVMADWDAAFRTWILNTEKFGSKGGRNGTGINNTGAVGNRGIPLGVMADLTREFREQEVARTGEGRGLQLIAGPDAGDGFVAGTG